MPSAQTESSYRNCELFTYAVSVCYVCVMYIIHKLQLYFLFLVHWSVCFGLSVFLNYLWTLLCTITLDNLKYAALCALSAKNASKLTLYCMEYSVSRTCSVPKHMYYAVYLILTCFGFATYFWIVKLLNC